ncbi:MAG: PorT family protein [Ignavibacteria bacterium]|nr:PorT family protein [Ignavibacteria bacterium]
MKTRSALTILLLLILNCAVCSQQSKFRMGLLGGASVDKLLYSFDDESGFLDASFSGKFRPAFSIGIFAEYDHTKSLGLKLQANYTTKGGILEKTVKYDSRLRYIQFSLLPQYNIHISEIEYDDIFYLNAGGYTAFMVHGVELISYYNDETERIITSNIKGTDYGLMFGLGIIARRFILDASFSHGLTNILADPVHSDLLNIKNMSFFISIGIGGGL